MNLSLLPHNQVVSWILMQSCNHSSTVALKNKRQRQKEKHINTVKFIVFLLIFGVFVNVVFFFLLLCFSQVVVFLLMSLSFSCCRVFVNVVVFLLVVVLFFLSCLCFFLSCCVFVVVYFFLSFWFSIYCSHLPFRATVFIHSKGQFGTVVAVLLQQSECPRSHPILISNVIL